MTRKRFFAVYLIAVIIVLPIVAVLPFTSAENGTNTGGLITADTIWIKAGSPYNLTGPLGVKQGVTLTIEAGTTVNLGYYYIQINGTLIAKGTITDLIQFNGGSQQGISVNSQTGSRSIIEYASVNSVLSVNSSTVDHCTITRGFYASGSSNINNNTMTSGVKITDQTLLVGNIISGIITSFAGPHVPIVSASTQTCSNIAVVVQNNTIIGGSIGYGGQAYTGISSFGHVTLTDNVITKCDEAIYVVSFATTEHIEIRRNTLFENGWGIYIKAGNSEAVPSDHLLIEDNLIANNRVGIKVEKSDGIAKPLIKSNNIFNNSSNLNWGLPTSIDVSGNWWGTTNESVISQSIYDKKNDFNLGTVTFQPILSSPNPDVPQAPTSPLPLPTPTPTAQTTPPIAQASTTPTSPTATPTIPELTAAIITTAILAVAAIAILYKNTAKNKTSSDGPRYLISDALNYQSINIALNNHLHNFKNP